LNSCNKNTNVIYKLKITEEAQVLPDTLRASLLPPEFMEQNPNIIYESSKDHVLQIAECIFTHAQQETHEKL